MLQVTWLLLTNESVLFQIKVAVLLWKLFMTSNPGWEKWKLLWIIFTKKMSQGSRINCKKFFMLFLPKILIMEKSNFFATFRQCDQIWRNFATLAQLKSFGQIFEGLFCILQIFNLTLAKMLHYWASFYGSRKLHT